MSELIGVCTRCGKERRVMVIAKVQVGTHSSPSLDPIFGRFEPPQTERICGNCITDYEILLELSAAVGFVIGVMIQTTANDDDSPMRGAWLKSLEMVRSQFIVYNNEPNTTTRGRAAAVRALGLGGE